MVRNEYILEHRYKRIIPYPKQSWVIYQNELLF